MDKKRARDLIVEVLSPRLKEQGFESYKSRQSFVRDTESGAHGVVFHVAQYGERCDITFFLSIRNDEVEELWHEVSEMDPQEQGASPTLMVGQGKLLGNPEFKYQARTDEDIVELADDFFAFMEEHGFSFFERYEGLGEMEEAVNATPAERTPYLNDPEQRAVKGLILARLAGRSNYEELKQTYRRTLDSFIEPIKRKFERMVQILEDDGC